MPDYRGTHVQIRGASDLERALRLLPQRVQGPVLRRSVMAGAPPVKQAMRTTAPFLTGTLAGSIIARSKRGTARTEAVVQVGPARPAFWGIFHEFGTRNMPGRPWMRPAFEASVGAALGRIGAALGKNIEREAARLAGPLAKSGLVRRR